MFTRASKQINESIHHTKHVELRTKETNTLHPWEFPRIQTCMYIHPRKPGLSALKTSPGGSDVINNRQRARKDVCMQYLPHSDIELLSHVRMWARVNACVLRRPRAGVALSVRVLSVLLFACMCVRACMRRRTCFLCGGCAQLKK